MSDEARWVRQVRPMRRPLRVPVETPPTTSALSGLVRVDAETDDEDLITSSSTVISEPPRSGELVTTSDGEPEEEDLTVVASFQYDSGDTVELPAVHSGDWREALQGAALPEEEAKELASEGSRLTPLPARVESPVSGAVGLAGPSRDSVSPAVIVRGTVTVSGGIPVGEDDDLDEETEVGADDVVDHVAADGGGADVTLKMRAIEEEEEEEEYPEVDLHVESETSTTSADSHGTIAVQSSDASFSTKSSLDAPLGDPELSLEEEVDFEVLDDDSKTTPPATPPEVVLEDFSRSRRKPWFETFFNDDYLRTVRLPSSAQVSRECDFMEQQLGLAKGATILDAGCGLGLHAVELARRGYSLVGQDISLPMLTRAAEAAQDAGVRIRFVHGDLRELALENTFDAILSWGTSFGFFDDDENAKVLSSFARALKPGGALLMQLVNRDNAIVGQPNLVWFEGDACICMEETKFNFFHSRLEVKRTIMLDDGTQRENNYAVRLYSLHEIGQLITSAGLKAVEVSGRRAHPGVFFGVDSPEILVLAVRKNDSIRAR